MSFINDDQEGYIIMKLKTFILSLFSIKKENKHVVISFFGVKLKLKNEKQLRNNPTGCIIDTTLLCNNNCSFCWRSNHPQYLQSLNRKTETKTMDFEMYKKIVDDVCRYESVKWFSLCGPFGEPLMNENIADFFEYAYKKLHFDKITINTNGLAIDKHDISRLLNSINEFSVSVDSIEPETYKKIHGHSHMQKVIDNIKLLINYKKEKGCVADIFVRFTENELNKGEFPQFEKYFMDLGVDYINYTQVHSFAGVKAELNNEKTVKACNQPLKIINFDFMGNMSTCCINWHESPRFGNIKNKTIKQMWESKQKINWNEKDRYFTEPCNNCSGLGAEVQHSKIIRNPNLHHISQ